jgi:hypothetical protein
MLNADPNIATFMSARSDIGLQKSWRSGRCLLPGAGLQLRAIMNSKRLVGADVA